MVPAVTVQQTRPPEQPSASATTTTGPLLLTASPAPIKHVRNFQFTADGSLVIVSEDSLLLFDVSQKSISWSSPIRDCGSDISISEDQVGILSEGALCVLDKSSGEYLYILHDGEKHFSTLAFSRDHKILAIGGFAQIRLVDARTGVDISAWETGDEGFSNFPWTKGITNLAFSEDGKTLFSANWWTGKVMAWDWPSTRNISSFGLKNTIRYQLTPDSRQILVDFNKKGFEVRDVYSGTLERVYGKIIGASGFLTFSRDGRRVAVWGYNTEKGSTAGVWELETESLLQEFSVGDMDKPGWSLAALSPDGKIIALSDEQRERIRFFRCRLRRRGLE